MRARAEEALMVDFGPSEEQKLMQDAVAQFARSVLRPRLRAFEAERAIPEDVRKTAHGMGLGLALVPEAAGGPGLGMATAVLLEEAAAYGDPAAPFAFGGPGAFGLAVTELGTPDQASRLLAPFLAEDGHARFGAAAWGERKAHPARAGLVTVARPDAGAFVLEGDKHYVLNADRASWFVVFAQVDETRGMSGIGAFVVPRDASGVHVGPRSTTLGLDVASFGSVRFDRVRVSNDMRLQGGDDFGRALVRFFAKNALLVAARGVGLAQAAFDITREYCESRTAFGKPIGHFQAVAFAVADRAMDLEAARAMVHRAAWLWDQAAVDPKREREALLRTAYAVSFTHEAAMRAGSDAVQLHGGAGFMRDYPVEKLMRDAKQLQLCGMTAEHADQLAAAIELGVALDPGHVLPSAETQSAYV
jgi:alkylation response protein AidB-like acyl-CoA dehydrogenase